MNISEVSTDQTKQTNKCDHIHSTWNSLPSSKACSCSLLHLLHLCVRHRASHVHKWASKPKTALTATPPMTLLPLRTSMHVCQNKSVPVLVRLQTNIPNYTQVKMQALETPSFDQENTPWHVSKHFMNPRSKQTSDHHFVFFAIRSFKFIDWFLPYDWSSWTAYIHSRDWDWLKGFLLLCGANYDRAWPYVLSLQHPPTLWVRSEGSSVSIAGLHCTAQGRFTPGQEFQTNSKK